MLCAYLYFSEMIALMGLSGELRITNASSDEESDEISMAKFLLLPAISAVRPGVYTVLRMRENGLLPRLLKTSYPRSAKYPHTDIAS